MRTSVCRAFCFVLLLGLILLTACRPNAPTAAQPRSSGEPKASEAVAPGALPDSNALVRVWTTADGLPVNFVVGIVRSRDGYLWLATSAGLVRFDGVRFRLYGKNDLPGFSSVHLVQILATRRGDVFFSSQQGDFGVVQDGRIRLLRRGGPNRGSSESFVEDDAGTVWGPIYSEATGFQPTVWRWHPQRGPDSVWADIRMSDISRLDGKICGWQFELACFDGQRFRRVPRLRFTYAIPAEDGSALLALDPLGQLVQLDTGGIRVRYALRNALAVPQHLYADGTARLHVPGQGLVQVAPDGSPPTVVVPADALWCLERQTCWQALPGGGTAWFSPPDDNERLALNQTAGRGGPVQRTLLPPGFVPISFQNTVVSRDGAVWWGTTDGLLRTVPARAETWGRSRGLGPSTFVTSVVADLSGTLWVGTLGSGLFRWRAEAKRPDAVPVPGENIRRLARGPTDDVWVSFWSRNVPLRVARMVDGRVTASQSVRYHADGVLLPLRDGRVATAGQGLAFLTPTTDGGFTVAAELDTTVTQIRALVEDGKGRLWRGDFAGVHVRTPDGRWTKVLDVPGGVIMLRERPDGDLFVGTRGQGLIRLFGATVSDDVTHLRTFTYTKARHDLHHDGIWWIEEDARGRLWMPSDAGIGGYDSARLDSVANGTAPTLDPLVLTMADGLAIDEHVGTFPAGARLPDGRLVFASVAGLSVIDPKRIVRDSAPPPVVLQEVTVDGVARDTIPAQFPPGTRNLAFRYAALDLVRPEGTRYRVRLDGFDPDWVEMGSRREAVYSNLPPGRYTLRVRGMNGDGTWNDAGAAQPFAIAPHWWQTLWARLGLLLGVMGLGYAGWRFQTNRMRTVELAAMVDERTAELRAERDTVAAQRAELAAQHTALQTLDRLKADLVASVSHEFRTPLMLVLGNLEDVLRRDALGADDQQQVRQAVRGAKRLERLVTQLLGVARLEADTRQSEAHVADFSDFVCSVTEAFTEVARRAGVSLECSTPPGVPVAFAPDAAEVILANLLSNALKFTPRGGHVRVSIVQDDGEAVVRVRDTGVGLSPGHLARIFDRFYQVDGTGTRSSDGAGIGLDLAHELARQQGGSLSAESEGLGFGCTFTLRLPLASKGEDGRPLPVAPSSNLTPHLEDVAGVLGLDAPEPPAHEAARAPAFDKPLVLVVDDHAAIRDLLARQLGEAFRVVAVSGGKRALVEARRQAFDAVVCDVMMPDMDGPTVLKAFRADAQLADVPFLFLTAKDDLSTEVEGFEHGADGYLVKPCPPERLEARLGRMVERRRRQREALVEAAGAGRVQPRTPNEKYVQQATEIVKERMGDSTFNAESLAEAMFTTVPTLNRTLKRITGKSSGAFIHVLKMERAAVLLGGGSSVAEAARAVGYRDAEHFSRMFQRYHGINPRDWKGRNGS